MRNTERYHAFHCRFLALRRIHSGVAVFGRIPYRRINDPYNIAYTFNVLSYILPIFCFMKYSIVGVIITVFRHI